MPVSSYQRVVGSGAVLPQSEPATPDQIPNHAGGYAFALDDWARLKRFLILGSAGNTYYQSARALTQENVAVIQRCLDADGPRVVDLITTISEAGRAPSNDPALVALALAMKSRDRATKRAAHANLGRIARIGTHWLHLASFLDGAGAWPRSTRSAWSALFNALGADKLAEQMTKYSQRDGWSMRDLLRVVHPKPSSPALDRVATTAAEIAALDAVYHYVVTGNLVESADTPTLLRGIARARAATTAEEIATLVTTYRLQREQLPNQWVAAQPQNAPVWRALLGTMGFTAILRNLANLTRAGVLAPLSAETDTVVACFRDLKRIQASRIHPLQVLLALRTYAAGYGMMRPGKDTIPTWQPVQQVVDALNELYYLAFTNIPVSTKRYVIGLDVSGSMDTPLNESNPLTCREAGAAIAMALMHGAAKTFIGGFTTEFTPLAISASDRLDRVIEYTRHLPFGGTDCALPMRYALDHQIEADAFVVITDNETWSGTEHPFKALQRYRRAFNNPEAKLVVLGMTATNITIADPNDPGMLDIAGFDAALPTLIADFVEGDI